MLFSHGPLAKLGEFEKVLKNYHPSPQSIDVLQTVPLVLLVAPAGAGRNTIIRNLIMTGKYRFIVSDTTRKPRINNGVLEQSGREYWFRDESDFLQDLRSGDFVEASIIHHQQVSGIRVSELTQSQAVNKVSITDIEIIGCDNISKLKADAHFIFVLPPNFDEWMKRLDGRGSMKTDEKKRRLESAINEISTALSRPYFEYIINWDLRLACERIHELVNGHRYITGDEQALAISHAKGLLIEIKNWLADN